MRVQCIGKHRTLNIACTKQTEQNKGNNRLYIGQQVSIETKILFRAWQGQKLILKNSSDINELISMRCVFESHSASFLAMKMEWEDEILIVSAQLSN